MTQEPAERPGAPSAVHDAYYKGFVFVLLVSFSPLKMFTYALPALFTCWMLLRTGQRVISTRPAAILCIGAATAPVFYALVVDEFLGLNYVLALITYSSFLPVIVLDGRLFSSPGLLRRLLLVSSVMIAFEGAYGMVQAIYGVSQTGAFSGGNGDYVDGTIHPSLSAEPTFSNPMFAVNMALMILACLSLPDVFKGRRRAYLLVGTAALVLASVVHVLVFLVAALVGAYVLTRTRTRVRTRSRSSYRNIVIVLALGGGLVYVALPEDVSGIMSVAESAVDLETLSVPRAVMLYRVFTDLPAAAPHQPFVGLGPGQFSSRASLIASGLYLGGPNAPKGLPMMAPQATQLSSEYCLDLMLAFADSSEFIGSTHQPFFSFLSVYTELGLIAVILGLWSIFRIIRRARARGRADPGLKNQVFLFATGTIFVVLLGLQENYWEVPQAILVGLLLLKVMYANIMYGEVGRTDVALPEAPR